MTTRQWGGGRHTRQSIVGHLTPAWVSTTPPYPSETKEIALWADNNQVGTTANTAFAKTLGWGWGWGTTCDFSPEATGRVEP